MAAIAHHTLLIIDGEIVIGGSFNDTKAAQEKHAEHVEMARNASLATP